MTELMTNWYTLNVSLILETTGALFQPYIKKVAVLRTCA
jgi:hypothetical protein